MTRPINIAWVYDPHGAFNLSGQEEFERELPRLERRLGYKLNVVAHGHGMDIVPSSGVDLLVFDYGGAAGGYSDTVWVQFEALLTWAEEHEGSLILLYSSFTGKMYENLVRSELGPEWERANVLLWVYTGWSDEGRVHEKQLKAAACAWFVGGEFAPYEEAYLTPEDLEKVKAIADGPLVKPGRRS